MNQNASTPLITELSIEKTRLARNGNPLLDGESAVNAATGRSWTTSNGVALRLETYTEPIRTPVEESGGRPGRSLRSKWLRSATDTAYIAVAVAVAWSVMVIFR